MSLWRVTGGLAPVVAVVLAVAGCAGGAATPEGACARQADADPTVREMMLKGAGSSQYQWENSARLQQARREAELVCLRGRGMAPKGGVERPRG